MVREVKLSPEGGVDSYPLSPMQQGMLFHRLQGGAPGVDVEQVICEVRERIRAARFEQAWREVVERHTALRTGFHWEDGQEPRQVVYAPSRVRLDFYHAEFGSEREARLGLEEYLTADRAQGFPSLMPSLVRVALLRGGPEHFWFVATYHHLALDARSMTVMFKEALDLHDALAQGRRIELPPARPFRAYIDWLQTLDLERAENFWREHLRGFRAATPLPLARTSALEPEEATQSAGELAFRLPEPLTARLRHVAQKHDVTLNTLVQAAWSIVLSRHAREDKVVFGALRACRKIPVDGARSIIGLFINTVPVRVNAKADAPLGQWLRELRREWVDLRDYEHTPLMRVQQWSDITPGQPLFESIVSYQEPAWDAALNALGGVWAQRHFDIRAQPNYPLALEVLAGATLTVKFIYNRARYADEAVARLMSHHRVVLEALAADTCETVGDLPMLTAREFRQLAAWNHTAMDYPRDQCVHTFLETVAEATPERIAVTDSTNALTYGELNARANRLAHRLKSLGIGADELVAVCMDRSTEMIVAWLGALKAGGAFVPLDPAYPKDRLAFQLQDSAARVVLTQSRLRGVLPNLPAAVTTIELAADGSGFENEPDANLPLGITARHLAYVIYTSGSTGQPKGVQIEHRALLNLITWHQRLYKITPADRATHLASPAFDASVWEIWPYVTAGASVHIPDDEARLAPAQLWRWMAEKKITISFMPTPLAEAAMNEPWPDDMAVRALLTGGDKLKRRPPENFPCALINHYGPTESTVVATCAVIDRHAPAAATPPIGGPIANTHAYVLDSRMRLVAPGVVGELYLGGESLARGYLKRPELTAEKFVRDPFAQAQNAKLQPQNGAAEPRLYRTGDLVRWTTHGELEFLGRMDGQVKIRGCRIELGEIEATLHQHPSARESVVLARSDERGHLQLIAYVVVHPDAAPSSEAEFMDFLRAKLPAYMVPSMVVQVDAWPLTPNGKIDRHALPMPEARSSESRGPFAAPRTPTEQQIAKVWAEVLGCPAVGLADNFFDLGGHSLLAAQVVTRLNAALSGAVSVRALFDQPTLAAFAREVEQQLENPGARVPALRMRRRVSRPEMELVQPN